MSGLQIPAPTYVIYFSDCTRDDRDGGDAHARMKQGVRRELGLPVDEFVDVAYPAGGFGAGMTLVSLIHGNQLTSADEPLGHALIMGNSAPRAATVDSGENGWDVCWAVAAANTLIVTTYDPTFFELAARLGLLERVNLLPMDDVLMWARLDGRLDDEQYQQMALDPFRGSRYIPWVGRQVLKYGIDVPSVPQLIPLTSARGVAARLDSRRFGNVYLDALTTDVDWSAGALRLFNDEKVPCYSSLRSIPPGKLGAVPASSRFGDRRFIMLAVQGGSARMELDVMGINTDIGDQVLHPDTLRATASV